MKHFLIEITYTAPMERVDEVLAEHRAFLQNAYDNGMLLYSGRQVPETGGIVLARAESQEALEMFFAGDPYKKAEVAQYRFVEFTPGKHQGFMHDWIAGN
ncbi:MAG TPA: YciI family protein [Chloroflexia bacterium]|nr:YciI family protein [Chloroflexia bacterium]